MSLFQPPAIACSRCGSQNTHVSRKSPFRTGKGGGLLGFLKDRLMEDCSPQQPGGTWYVTCKDCGHSTWWQVL